MIWVLSNVAIKAFENWKADSGSHRNVTGRNGRGNYIAVFTVTL